MVRSLDKLLRPGSVAVIGASAEADRVGGRPIRYLRMSGFAGPIWPVNPRHAAVQGIPCVPTIRDLPEAPDCVVIALPAAAAAEAFNDCAARGAGAAIVFAGGFAELGDEGRDVQQRMRDTARATGTRLLGPNCLGAFSPASGFYGSFTTILEGGLPEPNGLAIVSQSGAAAGHLFTLARQRGLGVEHWISTGNEADIELGECLSWLAADSATRVILVFTEGVRDRATLTEGLAAARRARKPVIVFKVGTSSEGVDAAASHTAALAGADAVYDSALRQFGALRARSLEEAVDFAEASLAGRYPSRGRLCALTISGGIGVHVADLTATQGLSLPILPDDLQQAVRDVVPFAGTRNPIDLTAQATADPAATAGLIERILRSGGYDALLAYFTNSPAMRPSPHPLRTALCALGAQYPDTTLAMCSIVEDSVATELRSAGWLLMPDPTRALTTLGALARLGRAFDRPSDPPCQRLDPPAIPARPMSEHEAKAILAEHGIPGLPERLVTSAAEASEAAGALGFPVALKIASPDIVHKTEVGGVVLGLADAGSVAAAHDALMTRVRMARPEARLLGTIVVPMAPRGIEMILGARMDPALGPVVMLGFGGVMVEADPDVVFRLAPIGPGEARRMLGELRGRKVLAGFRGMPAADTGALVAALCRLSELAASAARHIESIEVNPLLVLAEGKGILALDAHIEPARSGAEWARVP